jgi:single-strand DNA-binding protein
MNKVILMGRLTADPEFKQTPTGTAVATFTIAVNRRFAKEGQQQADFIRCVAWRQQAEFICKYFKKGSMICVVGNIQTRSWDGSDGKKQYATDIVVDEVYFTGEKRDADNTTANTSTAPNDNFNQVPPSWDDFTQGFDAPGDELPF